MPALIGWFCVAVLVTASACLSSAHTSTETHRPGNTAHTPRGIYCSIANEGMLG